MDNITKTIPELLDKYNNVGFNSNFGFYVEKTEEVLYINKNGIIDKKETKLYNFLTFDDKLVFSNWQKSINYYSSSNEILIFSISKSKKEMYGAFNKKGDIVIPPIFDNVRFLYENNKYLVCGLNNKYGLFKIDGEQILPIKFKNITNSNEDLIGVYYNNKWGVIDMNIGIENPKDYKQYVIPPIYDYLTPFEDGVATASFNNETFNIDKNNNKVYKKRRTS